MMSNSKIVEPWKKILQTGEWWNPPWWREEKYCQDSLFKQGIVENAFAELRSIFDARWMLGERDKLGEKHPIFEILVHRRGLLAFRQLMELGLNILTVKESGLLTETLKNDLTYTQNYQGAEFEIKILAHLLRKDFSVERGEGGEPDFTILKNSKRIWLEVKKLELSTTNKNLVVGEFFSDEAEIEKIFQNAIYDALEKFRRVGEIGVLLVGTFPLDNEIPQKIIPKIIIEETRTNPERYRFLSFVILFSSVSVPENGTLTRIYLPNPIKNPNLVADTLSEQVVQELTSWQTMP